MTVAQEANTTSRSSVVQRAKNAYQRIRRMHLSLNLPIWLRAALWIVAISTLAIMPQVSAPYVNFDLSMVMVYAIVGFGLNLLTGYTGQISLGHTAFFAIGAYTAAILAQNGVNYLLAIPVALIVCFVVGYLIGRPALRLRGLQLALVTIALAMITPAAIKRFDSVTHGQEGLSVSVAGAPEWTGLADDQFVYYLCLALALVSFVVARRLSRGSVGRSLVAIRQNEIVASTLGVRAATVKTQIFAISGAYAGLAGVAYVYVVQFVAPEAFGVHLAIAFLSLIVVGGLGTTTGAIIGAFFIHYVPTLTSSINQSASGIIYGGVLILFMFIAPYGIVGLIRYVLAPLVDRLPGRRSA